MIRVFWLEKTEKVFEIIQICGTPALLVSGAMLKAVPEHFTNWGLLKSIIELNQEYAFLIIPALTVVIGSVSFLKKRLGSLNTWKTITYLLEKYKKAIFENMTETKGDPEFHHRITLYKYVGWRFAFCREPWDGWMVPVARAGHTNQSSKIPRFRVFPNNPDKAEGIAGQTYVQKRIVLVENLPEIKEGSSEKEIDSYAENGFVSKLWIRKRKHCVIRSLIGIPIEVKNKPWGVMVIDSRRPNKIGSEDVLTTSQFTTLAEVMGKLIQE